VIIDPYAPLPDGVYARYHSGNAHAPVVIGAITIELKDDNTVRLVNERQHERREWSALAVPSLHSAFKEALASTPFPATPSTPSAPAGSLTITFSVRQADGSTAMASGFSSPEYRPLSFLFMQIASQMTGDAVLRFTVPSEGTLLTEPKLVDTFP
jgi:hypothetical protein